MQGGNSAVVTAWRIDRGRIRYGVDCGDKEQQAKYHYNVLVFQSALEHAEAVIPPAALSELLHMIHSFPSDS